MKVNTKKPPKNNKYPIETYLSGLIDITFKSLKLWNLNGKK